MGRSLRLPGARRAAADTAASGAWWDEIAANARAHGAMPYVVDGFTEITDAVRRGHAVLIRRERAEVADGMTIFDDSSAPMTGAFSQVAREDVRTPVVAILRFDLGSARFVLQDPASPIGAVQLTPRRLARYLESPDRCTGVALGA